MAVSPTCSTVNPQLDEAIDLSQPIGLNRDCRFFPRGLPTVAGPLALGTGVTSATSSGDARYRRYVLVTAIMLLQLGWGGLHKEAAMNRPNRKGYSSIWFLAIALMLPIAGRAQTQNARYWIETNPKQTIFNLDRASYHSAIAQGYRREANQLDISAGVYADMAETYRKSMTLDKEQDLASRQIANICEGLASRLRTEAQEERNLADMHEGIASLLKQQGLPVEADPPRQEKWVD